MNRLLFRTLPALSLILTACTPALGSAPAMPARDLARTDEQGAVVVEVKPVNLDASVGDLTFAVSMNTHSVDLGMDLARLAILSTDTGIQLQATGWKAPSGGHHISGMLAFPASKDGKPVLEGASELTLTITNVDAPTRVFAWNLK